MKRPLLYPALVALVVAATPDAGAQTLGTFRWQLQPYCNVVTATVVQQAGGIFTLDGYDDQCGAGQRASVTGTAFANPDDTIGIGLNTVLAPGGAFVHVEARISLAALGGPWRDSGGNGGTLAFTPGGSAGGPPRPVSASGVAPGSIGSAQLAPGSIGAGHVAAGAIGAAQIDTNQVQKRVAATCTAAHYLRGINPDGSVQCEPVPVTLGARAIGGYWTTFTSGAGIVIASLSEHGGGALVVPFRARLFAQGVAHIYRNVGGNDAAMCSIRFAPSQTDATNSVMAYLIERATTSIAVQNAIDVEPGTYDVRLSCSSYKNSAHLPQFSVLAVPR